MISGEVYTNLNVIALALSVKLHLDIVRAASFLLGAEVFHDARVLRVRCPRWLNVLSIRVIHKGVLLVITIVSSLISSVDSAEDVAELKELIQLHADYTGSTVATGILELWEHSLSQFVKVMPRDYKRALTELTAESEVASATD